MKKILLGSSFLLLLLLVSCPRPPRPVLGVTFKSTKLTASKINLIKGEPVTITIDVIYALADGLKDVIDFNAKTGICFVDEMGNCKVNLDRNSNIDTPAEILLSPSSTGAIYGGYLAAVEEKEINHEAIFTSNEPGIYLIKGFVLYDSDGELIANNAQFSKEVTITFE